MGYLMTITRQLTISWRSKGNLYRERKLCLAACNKAGATRDPVGGSEQSDVKIHSQSSSVMSSTGTLPGTV